MSIGLLLFFLFVLIANIAIGYIIAILLGIGPPDFRTAWTRIKLSAYHLAHSNSGHSQAQGIVGFMTSLVGRFKKHAPPTQESSDNHPDKPEQPNSPA